MQSNPFDRIESQYDNLTANEKDIAVYIMNHPEDAVRCTSEQLAGNTGVSKSAVSRFCRKLNYASFGDFRFDLSRFLISQNIDRTSNYDVDTNPIQAVTNAYADTIRQIPECVSKAAMEKLIRLILKAQKIYILGYNRTYNAAQQLHQRLLHMGIAASSVESLIDMKDLSAILTAEDLVILFTVKDKQQIYSPVVNALHARRCPVVCITMSHNLAFRNRCTETIVLPRISMDTSISFLDDQAIFFVFIETLLPMLAKKLG